jgi:hypothetical protein
VANADVQVMPHSTRIAGVADAEQDRSAGDPRVQAHSRRLVAVGIVVVQAVICANQHVVPAKLIRVLRAAGDHHAAAHRNDRRAFDSEQIRCSNVATVMQLHHTVVALHREDVIGDRQPNAAGPGAFTIR